MGEVFWREGHKVGGERIDIRHRPGVEFHHTVKPGADVPLADAMRAMWRAHVLTNGWADIFYNVVVAPNGDHAIGRPWDRKAGEVEHLTVCFLGNYEDGADTFTQAQKNTAGLLRWHLAAELGGGNEVRTHGERDSSSCPGDQVQRWADELRRAPVAPSPTVSAAVGHLAAPVVAAVACPGGYWLVGADGGVFAFGAALPIEGLPAFAVVPAAPIVAALPSPTFGGLVLVGADGGVFTLGDALYHGSIPQQLAALSGH